jgi:translation initiation factor IF-3
MLRHLFVRLFSSLPSSFLLISEKGDQLGQHSIQTAAQFYNSITHQLISVRQTPPVVKILKIESTVKPRKVIPQKQKKKEVKIGPKIADHDLSLKQEQIQRFLEKGFLVKVHTATPLSPELTKYVIHSKVEKKATIYDLKIK